MGIPFEIRASPHLAPRSVFSEIRTQNACLLRTYFEFLGIPRLVMTQAPAHRLVILAIDEMHDGSNIWDPDSTSCRPRTGFSKIRTQNIVRAYFGFW